MAVINPALNGDVLNYDTTQTTEINRLAVESKANKDELAKRKDYVIEEGKNYRKWFSGLFEQWGVASGAVQMVAGKQFGFNYYTVNLGNFPLPFVGVPEINCEVRDTGQLFLVCARGAQTNTKLPTMRYLHQIEGRTDVLPHDWYAIGRWKA